MISNLKNSKSKKKQLKELILNKLKKDKQIIDDLKLSIEKILNKCKKRSNKKFKKLKIKNKKKFNNSDRKINNSKNKKIKEKIFNFSNTEKSVNFFKLYNNVNKFKNKIKFKIKKNYNSVRKCNYNKNLNKGKKFNFSNGKKSENIFRLYNNTNKFKKKLKLNLKNNYQNINQNSKIKNVSINIANNNYYISIIKNFLIKNKSLNTKIKLKDNDYFTFNTLSNENKNNYRSIRKSTSFEKNLIVKNNLNLNNINNFNLKDYLNKENKNYDIINPNNNKLKLNKLNRLSKINCPENNKTNSNNSLRNSINKIDEVINFDNQKINYEKLYKEYKLDNNLINFTDNNKIEIKNIIIELKKNSNNIANIQFIYNVEDKIYKGYKHGFLIKNEEKIIKEVNLKNNDKIVNVFISYKNTINYFSIITVLNKYYQFGKIEFNNKEQILNKKLNFEKKNYFLKSYHNDNKLKLLKIN